MSPRLSDLFLSSQSDQRLVSLARAGHERAFVVIVERYRSELHALARRLCSDGRAEDVVQQAFMSAFAALDSGAEVKHLRGWLYRIVRNAASRSRTPVYAPLDGATASADTVEEIVQQRAVAMTALAELERLPARQRQAIVDTALGGMTRSEVASTMGLSEGAVRQLVHRARSALRTVVTAVTPWPLARWLVAVRPGGSGAAEVAAGAGIGATSSGGVAIKLGALLASGTLVTGVAAVEVHGVRLAPHHAGGHAAAAGREQARVRFAASGQGPAAGHSADEATFATAEPSALPVVYAARPTFAVSSGQPRGTSAVGAYSGEKRGGDRIAGNRSGGPGERNRADHGRAGGGATNRGGSGGNGGGGGERGGSGGAVSGGRSGQEGANPGGPIGITGAPAGRQGNATPMHTMSGGDHHGDSSPSSGSLAGAASMADSGSRTSTGWEMGGARNGGTGRGGAGSGSGSGSSGGSAFDHSGDGQRPATRPG